MSESYKVYDKNDFNIPGFSIFFNESVLNRSDGCVIYVRQEYLICDRLLVHNDLKLISVTLQKNNKIVDILATYRGFATTKESFIDNLNAIMQSRLNDPNRMCIFTGDINIDLLDIESIHTINYITLMQGHGFVSLVNKPTRKYGHARSCLDHLFIKCKTEYLQNVHAVILEHGLTDHDPILLNVQLNNIQLKKQIKNAYQYFNKGNFLILLERERWDDVLSSVDSNVSTGLFINKLNNMISDVTITKKISSKNRRLKPWISAGLLVSIKTRDRLKKECTINHNNILLINKYKAYRNILTKVIKKAKYSYYRKLAQQNLKDPKKIWNIIKEATNEQRSRSEINNLLDSENREITDKQKITEEFNKYFSNVGKQLAERIGLNNAAQINKRLKRTRFVDSFFLNPVSEKELKKHIMTLKGGVKGGEDGISSDMIKRYQYYLIKPLLHITNIVFVSGVFPDILKTAIITPLHKQGDKKLANNYRPIALTSTISKVIEKCFKSQLMRYLDRNKLLNMNQYGFRKDSNTENALCRVTETILKNLDMGKKVIGIFLDMQKAFDTVAHQILLDRLEDIGVRGIPKDLIESYLHRKIKTKLNDAVSQERRVDYGVPQGTVLSAILFNIYINGVFSSISREEGSVFCFADDSAVVIYGEDWKTTKLRAERALQLIKIWLDGSLLSMNIEKTKFVAFSLSTRSLPDFQTLTLHRSLCRIEYDCACDHYIERKNYIKYLGVLIDETFTWKEQVKSVAIKLRKLIYKFYELKNILSLHSLKSVYGALVESILSYGIVVWGGAGVTILKKLEIAQKWVIKIILNKNKRYPTELVYKDSGLFSINQLYIKAIVRFMLKTTYYRENITHEHNTRVVAQDHVALQNPRHTVCQQHIYSVGPKVYNSLPNTIKSKPYFKCKKKINDWIKTSNYSINFLV